ncbi:hypothetical protein GCM10023331_17200 [Algivirga pacifica]|uniref:Lipoprotein n=2 Tax=Algivirga pacifica TaxID=1162670 RepID=A0ABP9DBV3_9BACT
MTSCALFKEPEEEFIPIEDYLQINQSSDELVRGINDLTFLNNSPDSIQSFECFLNGELIYRSDFQESEYNVRFDTFNYPNGSYELVAILTTINGEVSKEILGMNIHNYQLDFSFAPDYFRTAEQAFLLVTDEQGTLQYIEPVVNGGQYHFKDYNGAIDETFLVHVFYGNQLHSYYANASLSSWNWVNQEEELLEETDSLGTVMVEMDLHPHIPKAFFGTVSGSDSTFHEVEIVQDTLHSLAMEVVKNHSNLYLSYEVEDTVFVALKAAQQPGDTVRLSLDDFTAYSKHQISISETNSFQYRLMDNESRHLLTKGSTNTSSITTYTPDQHWENFYFTGTDTGAQFNRTYEHWGTVLPSDIVWNTHTFEYTVQSDALSFQQESSASWAEISLEGGTGTQKRFWTLHLPAESLSIKVPKLPNEVLPNFLYGRYEVKEVTWKTPGTVKGYEEYLSRLSSGALKKGMENKTYETIVMRIENEEDNEGE